jgi:hypothetical protein
MHDHQGHVVLLLVGVAAFAAHLVGAAELAMIGCEHDETRGAGADPESACGPQPKGERSL